MWSVAKKYLLKKQQIFFRKNSSCSDISDEFLFLDFCHSDELTNWMGRRKAWQQKLLDVYFTCKSNHNANIQACYYKNDTREITINEW